MYKEKMDGWIGCDDIYEMINVSKLYKREREKLAKAEKTPEKREKKLTKTLVTHSQKQRIGSTRNILYKK